MIISFIIIEYFSLNEIKRCFENIPIIPNFETEFIISSNSQYSLKEQKIITEKYSKHKWIFNPQNGGFAYAMNNGLAIARGDYLVIMNPDCKIINGIDNMTNFLIKHPNIGALGPQIIDSEGNLQDSCREYVSLPSFIKRQIIRVLRKKETILYKSDYSSVQTVDWIIGAFIMVSRKAYELTKGLSDDYFMYAEDLDWCTRIRKAGLEVVYYPKAIIEYKGTRSARKSRKYAKIFIKSHLIYWKKYGFWGGYPKRQKIKFEE